MLTKGQVILANAPYSDGSGAKLRPVVILSPLNHYNDVLAAEITSKHKPDTILLKNPKLAGVRPGSKVKVRVITVNVAPKTQPIGQLSPEDADTVTRSIKELF